MTRLRRENFGEFVLDCLPTLKTAYEEEVETFGEPLHPHTIAAMVLNPYVEEIATPPVDMESMQRLFDCVETTVLNANEEVLNVMHTTFVERIFFQRLEVRDACLEFMGPNTLEIYGQVKEGWTNYIEKQGPYRSRQ